MTPPTTPHPRQQTYDRRDGRQHAEGDGDVHGPVDALLRDAAVSEGEAV